MDIDKPDLTKPANIVTGGPFVLGAAVPGETIPHLANPGYFKKDCPFLDRIDTITFSDPDTLLAAVITGQVHVVRAGGIERTVGIPATRKLEDAGVSIFFQPASDDFYIVNDRIGTEHASGMFLSFGTVQDGHKWEHIFFKD